MTLKQRVDKQDRQIKALHTLLKRGFAAQVDATIRDIYDTAMRSRFERCLDSPWAKISARLEDIVGMLNIALAKMLEWSEESEGSLADVLRRQAALADRVRNGARARQKQRKSVV